MPEARSKAMQSRIRFERLEARISTAQKQMFKKAAALEGRTLTDFVVDCVMQEARRVIHDHDVIRLSERDQRIFVETLLNPPAPNKALLSAMKKHAKITGSR